MTVHLGWGDAASSALVLVRIRQDTEGVAAYRRKAASDNEALMLICECLDQHFIYHTSVANEANVRINR